LLPRANAAFNDSSLQSQESCHPKTRVELFKNIEEWFQNSQGQFIYWLNGLAGTGKSTIAKTIATKFHDNGRLGASFFFARGQGDRGHAKMFFTTLAFQLSNLSDAFSYTISEAIDTNRDIVHKSFGEQWRHLIYEPLGKCPHHQAVVVIVIDALDECDSEQDIGELLRLISQAKDINGCSLRFLITSRPEVPVKHGFDKISYVNFYDYALHKVDDRMVKDDIIVYLTSELGSINQKYSGSEVDWPSKEDVRCLAEKAGKFFIYAATACRFIDQGGSSLFKERLSEILEDDSDGTEEIDKMYTQVLEHHIRSFRDKDKKLFFERFQHIIGTIVILFSPLAVVALNELLPHSSHTSKPIKMETIKRTLSPLGSILDIPNSDKALIRLFHLSFRDFLLNNERCNNNFWIPEEKMHSYLVDCCIRLMSTTLKQNICDLQGSGVFTNEVENSRVMERLPQHVQYACQYWTKHLERLKELHGNAFDLRDYDQVHKFLKKHFLHWLEALSLMGKTPLSVLMIIQLENLAVS
jgi:hypothetical protein